jgi:AcrR family transcriptional regulator
MADGARLPAGSAGRRDRAERILDVTAELLLLHGYRRVTVEDVAAGAGIGKGTIYLHWKTREALFWAATQREAMRLLEQILGGLAGDPALALPGRLMRAIFLEAARRPLVRALLLSDAEVLGSLAKDAAVAAAQRELAGNENYLELLAAHGVLRPGLTPETGGYILGSVMRGFFTADDDTGALPLGERADLLADVVRRALEAEEPVPADAVTALGARVADLFTAIIDVQRAQLERAYG